MAFIQQEHQYIARKQFGTGLLGDTILAEIRVVLLRQGTHMGSATTLNVHLLRFKVCGLAVSADAGAIIQTLVNSANMFVAGTARHRESSRSCSRGFESAHFGSLPLVPDWLIISHAYPQAVINK